MALFLLIVLFLNFDESISFLVNTTNTGLTSYEFQPLSQYIIDEKQLRHRLESDFASLQQELKNTKTTLEQQLNNTKSELGAVKTILSQHSKNYESLRLQQDKDASNRNQIQHELTGLIEDFQNLSIAFSGTHTTGQVFNGTNKTEETILFNAWYPTKLSVSHGDTIVFNQVLSNIGNGYNSTTGIFTAPKRGSYLFNVQACVPPYGEGSFIIAVRQQSFVETVLNILKYSDTSHHNTVSNSVPVHLARGQEVWVEAWATGKLYHDSSCGSQFSGVLVGI